MDKDVNRYRASIRTSIERDVPDDIQRALLSLIIAEYQAADEYVSKNYPKHEQRALLPQLRRANIEAALAGLEARFAGRLEVHAGHTTRKYGFRFIQCGRVTMTVSSVGRGEEMPRRADFRQAFAAEDLFQMRLEPENEAIRQAVLNSIRTTYAIVTHEPSSKDRSRPAQVSLQVVDRDCQPVVTINFTEKFTRLDASNAATAVVEDRIASRLTAQGEARKQEKQEQKNREIQKDKDGFA